MTRHRGRHRARPSGHPTALTRCLPAALTVVLALALGAGPAGAGSPDPVLDGYDGHNPFDCTLQQVGRGTDFPDPDADPFCVEYDKTGQNLDQLGIVRFLSGEPVRVAAAISPCFYYQKDHWQSQLIQGVEATETYSFDGAYFIDKARGIGGVSVENFTLHGVTVDPSALPGFPDEYEPYFGPGRGGIVITTNVPVDPRCVSRAQQQDPYAR